MRSSLVDRRSVERLLLLAGALQAGLIDALATGDGLPVEKVAELAGAEARAGRIVLEALVAEGVAERSTGTDGVPLYRLSALGRAHLIDEGPALERFGLLHQVSKMRGWLELPEVIRTGHPPPRDGVSRDLRTMVSAMGERDPAVLDEIVEDCLAYAGTIETMLDVGGAVGHVARHFSRRGVKASLLDRGDVLPVAREFLGEEAVVIALIAGDFTVSLPAGPFDLVYFGNVCHIYSPQTNARVIEEAFSITSPGGTIALQDYFSDRSPGAALFAVNMLRSTEEGGVWSEGLHRHWLGDAGFVDIKTLDVEANQTQLMLGRRPAGL